jgi:hypothetical protein
VTHTPASPSRLISIDESHLPNLSKTFLEFLFSRDEEHGELGGWANASSSADKKLE